MWFEGGGNVWLQDTARNFKHVIVRSERVAVIGGGEATIHATYLLHRELEIRECSWMVIC